MTDNDRQLVLTALGKGLYKYLDVAANTGLSMKDTLEIIRNLILEAIEAQKGTLPQIKKHYGISMSFDISSIIDGMISDKLLVRIENFDGIKGFFRAESAPDDFVVRPDGTCQPIYKGNKKQETPKSASSDFLKKEVSEPVNNEPLNNISEDQSLKTASPESKKPTKRGAASPVRDKILQNLAQIQAWAQEGKTKVFAADALNIDKSSFITYFKTVPQLAEHWNKGIELGRLAQNITSASPRKNLKPTVTDKILANLDLVERFAAEGKTKEDLAKALGLNENSFANFYFSKTPEAKEAWEKGKALFKEKQSEIEPESRNPKIEQAVSMIEENGLTPDAKNLVREILEENSDRNPAAKIPGTPEEDEAFDELAKKLGAKEIRHKIATDIEASGDYVGNSLPTGLKHLIGDADPGQVKLDCEPNCGHNEQEHKFFDRGYEAGLKGDEDLSLLNLFPSGLGEAFKSGHSVGLICYRDNLKTQWKSRGYFDGSNNNAPQKWDVGEFDPFVVEAYTEGLEEGRLELQSRLSRAQKESFYDHRDNGDSVPQGDWKIVPAPKFSDGEKVDIVGVPALVGKPKVEDVEIDPRFANTIEHLSKNGRSKEGFEIAKQKFLSGLPEFKIPGTFPPTATLLMPDTIDAAPQNRKVLEFKGGLTVRMSIEGNMFDAPREVRRALEDLFDWSEKHANQGK